MLTGDLPVIAAVIVMVTEGVIIMDIVRVMLPEHTRGIVIRIMVIAVLPMFTGTVKAECTGQVQGLLRLQTGGQWTGMIM